MANTVDLNTAKTIQVTQVPMTGSDVAFTFDKLVTSALIQASAATSSMYIAAASASHAAIVLPNGQSAPPLKIWAQDLRGEAVTFNGTNATNVTVIEFLQAST
ncbi:MAG: hypothetical protein ACYCQK_01430 [Acidiferrobacteraceae bacterium]